MRGASEPYLGETIPIPLAEEAVAGPVASPTIEDLIASKQDGVISGVEHSVVSRDTHGLGLVQVYTGHGKGKTTASLGLALRALGHGFSVYIVQFLKGGSFTGELTAIERFLPQMQMLQYGQDCIFAPLLKAGTHTCGDCRVCFLPMDQDTVQMQEGFDRARRTATSGLYNLVILDEVNVAMSMNLLPVQQVLDLIREKHANTELILTGRNAPKAIIDTADLVTEMKMIKHPFYKGIPGRRGIEY